MRALGARWKIIARVAEQNEFVASLGAAIAEDLAWRLADFTFANYLGLS